MRESNPLFQIEHVETEESCVKSHTIRSTANPDLFTYLTEKINHMHIQNSQIEHKIGGKQQKSEEDLRAFPQSAKQKSRNNEASKNRKALQ